MPKRYLLFKCLHYLRYYKSELSTFYGLFLKLIFVFLIYGQFYACNINDILVKRKEIVPFHIYMYLKI